MSPMLQTCVSPRRTHRPLPAPAQQLPLVVEVGAGPPDLCAAIDARPVLLLANHLGDLRVLQEAITAARNGAVSAPPEETP